MNDSRPLLAWTLVASALSIGAAPQSPTTKGISLFSELDAEELRVEGNRWDPIPRARSASLGPVIIVQSPDIKRVDGSETIEASSPTRFVVRFEENQAPIDMSSLEVTAKKGVFRRSLTDTLRPFVHGNSLEVEEVEVPSGKFQIEIQIKDRAGQGTERTYRLIVEN